MAMSAQHGITHLKVQKLLPRLKVVVKNEPRRLRSPEGPPGRLRRLSQTVTALFKHERIELHFNRAAEARGYTERLIADAIRHGDCHKPTMDNADFWLQEKGLIHKLFKVLVPRFCNYQGSYTLIHQVPIDYEGIKSNRNRHAKCQMSRAVLELKGNPYPTMPKTALPPNPKFLTNVLLAGAKSHFRNKAKEGQSLN